MRSFFNRFGVLSALLVVAALSVLSTRIDGIRIATADELNAAMAATDVLTGRAVRVLDLCIGRFYAIVKWPLLEFLMHDCDATLLTVIRVAAFFLCAFSAALFVRGALENNLPAALFLALACLLLPVVVTYQPLFYNPMLWGGWTAVWLMGVLAMRPESKLTNGCIAGLFGLSLLCHEMNAVFVVWPWLVHRLVRGGPPRGGLTGANAMGLAVLAAYGGIAIFFRMATADVGISYGGGTVAFHPIAAMVALLANSCGSLPGLELWLSPRWEGVGSSLFVSPREFADRLVTNLTLMDYALATGAGLLGWMFLRTGAPSGPARDKPSHHRLFWLLVFMVLAPNSLLSVTEKYQAWACQRMWPYYYSWMSYLAWVAIGVVGLDWLRTRGQNRRLRAFAAAGGIAFLAAVSAATSRESTDFFREYRFDHSMVPPIPK